MTQKTAKDSMTPISQTFSLDINSKLDMFVPPLKCVNISECYIFIIKTMILLCFRHTMRLVMSKGHSRIPIYSGSPKNIIGLVLVSHILYYLYNGMS